MKRVKTRIASLVFAVILAFGLFGVMPATAYAALPTISGLSTTAVDATSATYTFDLDVDGNVYALLGPNIGPAPSASQIASQGDFLGSLLATNSPFIEVVSGLTPGQDYIVYMTTEDPADPGVFSTPVSVSFSTAVCVINGTDYYASLADALLAVQPSDTITLLADITEATPINVGGTDLTIDLAGYNLDLSGDDITVTNGNLTIDNGGTVTVGTAISAYDSALTVNADIVSGYDGVDAFAGSIVAINGNISAAWDGLHTADEGTTVTMIGNITNAVDADDGVEAANGATVTVTGNISSTYGIYVYNDGLPTTVTLIGNINASNKGILASGEGDTVTVTGDIASDNYGIDVYNGVVVIMTGDITSGYNGINAQNDVVVTMTGNITSDYDGINAFSGAAVTVTGNIICANDDANDDYSYAGIVSGDDSTIVTLNGNLSVTGLFYIGVYAGGSAQAFINGSIVATGDNSVGAFADESGEITVEGTITAPLYVGFWDYSDDGGITVASSITTLAGWNTVFLTQAQNDATSLKPGYLQYSWTTTDDQGFTYTSYIWVRIPDVPNPPIPQTGDTHSWTDVALLLALAALGVTGIVLARKLRKGSRTTL